MTRTVRIALVSAVIAIFALLPLMVFAVARAMNDGEVAPNVMAGDVHIGGLSEDDARSAILDYERRLRENPAPFSVKDREFNLDTRLLNIDIDAAGILEDAMQVRRHGGFFAQFSEWVRSFDTTLVVLSPISFDGDAADAILDAWQNAAIGSPPHEGGVSVEGTAVVADYPRAGEGIDHAVALRMMGDSLSKPDRSLVALPTESIVPEVTNEQVDNAVLLATRMITGAVTLTAEDPAVEVTFPPEVLALALRSDVVVNSPADIALSFDPAALVGVLETHREAIEKPARIAEFEVLDNDAVILKESRPQTILNPTLVAETLADVAVGPDRGEFPFETGEEPWFTTEEAREMGPIGRVVAYTTEHPSGQPRVTNIHLMADAVNNTIVWPGETFSLNDHVGQRTETKGYVPAPMILRGEIVDDVGGGVSQFATTFYNAVFFGCYEDVSHRAHSYYFSRYPEGREATISWPEPDLVFRNDSDALIIIKTSYSATTITVKFYGNSGNRDCDANLSERYNFTDPETKYEANSSRNPGGGAVIQTGQQGWSVDITRIFTYTDGSTSEETWTHRYVARPEIIEVHPCDVPGSNTACPIAVPSLVGLTFAEAAARLEANGFKIADGGTVTVESAGQDGLVQSQSTGAGAYAAAGSVITVKIGSYTAPPTTTTTPPDTTSPPDTTTTTVPPDEGG